MYDFDVAFVGRSIPEPGPRRHLLQDMQESLSSTLPQGKTIFQTLRSPSCQCARKMISPCFSNRFHPVQRNGVDIFLIHQYAPPTVKPTLCSITGLDTGALMIYFRFLSGRAASRDSSFRSSPRIYPRIVRSIYACAGTITIESLTFSRP